MRKIFSLRTVVFALIVLAMSMATATTSFAQIRISVGFGPPALPVYEQPLCPGDGYIWTPGYWAWDPDINDYYWVPGTWILAPEVGYLWTPPYWAWADGGWLFYDGYWGPHVGFYGGINYGFGYFGYGFVGGRWDHDRFFYNRAVMNINVVNIHNVYEERVENVRVNYVSYNGGPGGIEARPRREEEMAARDRHIGAVAAQTQHWQAARGNPELRASANHGRPPVAATGHPGEFSGREVAPAREAGGTYNPPANRGGNVPRGESGMSRTPVHPNELPKAERVTPNTGNGNRDRKFQQQQDKMLARQEQQQQKLQQQQEKEHQQLAKQNADEARKQQTEQRHQQQTQQLQEKHTQQRQQLQQKYSPPAGKRK
jgi:WXXGXW repeat (2 copies)